MKDHQPSAQPSQRRAAMPLQVIMKKDGMNEPKAVDYVRDFLAYLHFEGPFEVRVVKKAKGSGFHHGIAVKIGMNPRLRLLVQHGGNDTRYLCTVHAKHMQPHDIELAMNPWIEKHWTRDLMKPADQKKKIKDALAPAPSLLASDSDAVPAAPAKFSFAGKLDESDIGLLLIAIRMHQGIGNFTAEDFRTLMRTEGYAPNASNHTLGQLLRRVVSRGYLGSNVGKGGEKIYGLTELGFKLLASHDTFVSDSARQALNITESTDLHQGLADLEKKARQHAEAAQELKCLNGKISSTDTEIAEIERKLVDAMARREGLRVQAAAALEKVNDKDLLHARDSYAGLQAKLTTLPPKSP